MKIDGNARSKAVKCLQVNADVSETKERINIRGVRDF